MLSENKPTLSITITHLIASTFGIDQWERDGSGNASKIREGKNPKKKRDKREKKSQCRMHLIEHEQIEQGSEFEIRRDTIIVALVYKLPIPPTVFVRCNRRAFHLLALLLVQFAPALSLGLGRHAPLPLFLIAMRNGLLVHSVASEATALDPARRFCCKEREGGDRRVSGLE